MKNMVPEEIEVPKAPVQNNLFSDEADAAEKMKDEKPAFDFQISIWRIRFLLLLLHRELKFRMRR